MSNYYVKYLKRVSLLAFVLALFSINAKAQTTHRFTSTEAGALRAFIQDLGLWAPGDTILLVTAGEYLVDSAIGINQNVTIMGDPTLATRPVVKATSGFNAGVFVPRVDNLSVTLKGFNFEGKSMNAANAEQRASILQYAAGASNAMGGNTIRVEDMRATGLRQGIELFPSGGRLYERVVINNVEWSDISEWAFWPRINAVKEVSVTNSTFNTVSAFFNNLYFVNPSRTERIEQNVVIDRNTFYNIGDNNRALIQMNDGSDSSATFTFTNNIVSTVKDPGNSRPFLMQTGRHSGDFTLSNNTVHNFLATAENKKMFNLSSVAALPFVTVTDSLNADPGFADPAAGNFTLPQGSPLLTAGTNGSAQGDPRWAAGNVTSVKPEQNVVLAKMYPNPNHGTLYISAPAQAEVTIINLTGSVVHRGTVDREGTVDIAHLKAGMYITTIKSGGHVQSLRLMKQ